MSTFDLWLRNLAIVEALLVILWLISLRLKDASIIDIFWGVGFAITAWATFAMTAPAAGDETRRVLLVALTSVWGLRLSGYLAWRNLGKGEDPRYRAMREEHGESFAWRSLFTVFLLQGVLIAVVSLPVQVGQLDSAPGAPTWLDLVGIGVFAVGLFFETVGDWQLARFKADPSNRGKVLDSGLWRYTRHPNYFGDFCVWWGLYLIALAGGDAWWTVVGPVIMSVLLMRVSGVTLLEKSLDAKPGYADYVRRTSAFFPRPPRS